MPPGLGLLQKGVTPPCYSGSDHRVRAASDIPNPSTALTPPSLLLKRHRVGRCSSAGNRYPVVLSDELCGCRTRPADLLSQGVYAEAVPRTLLSKQAEVIAHPLEELDVSAPDLPPTSSSLMSSSQGTKTVGHSANRVLEAAVGPNLAVTTTYLRRLEGQQDLGWGRVAEAIGL